MNTSSLLLCPYRQTRSRRQLRFDQLIPKSASLELDGIEGRGAHDFESPCVAVVVQWPFSGCNASVSPRRTRDMRLPLADRGA